MPLKHFLKKERRIWHKRFTPSLIAGLAVAIITLFFKMTASNIVMFASLGSSAAILTHKYIHRLTVLYTVILSYFVAVLVSVPISYFFKDFPFAFPLSVLLAVTLTTLVCYLFNIFHPPAISASVAFLLLEGSVGERFLVFAAVLILLIIVKLLTYAFYYEHLSLKKIHHELIFWEKKIFKPKK